MLLELADAQQLGKQFREANSTYNQILNEKLLPQRDEELVQDMAAALHLAGDYAESDKVCVRFRDAYPKSTLLPAVLFRYAENAYFSALAAEKLPNPPTGSVKRPNGWTKRLNAIKSSSKSIPNLLTSIWRATASAWPITRKAMLDKAREISGGDTISDAPANSRSCLTSWPIV